MANSKANEAQGYDVSMRVGHAERQDTIDHLTTAMTRGQLDMDELDERIAAATRAKTHEELRVLTADLPPAGAIQAAGRDLQRYLEPLRRAFAAIWARRIGRMALPAVVLGLVGIAVLGLFEGGDHEHGDGGPQGEIGHVTSESASDVLVVWSALATAIAVGLAVALLVVRRRANRT